MRGRIGSDKRRRAIQTTYEMWWLGKYVKQPWEKEFRKVTAIEFNAPPSGIYGEVLLTFDNGEQQFINPRYAGNCPWGQVYRPRKSDLEVRDT